MRTLDQRWLLPTLVCAPVLLAATAFANPLNSEADGPPARRNNVLAPAVRLPLAFIENKGQFDPRSAFQVRLPRLTMSVQKDGWELQGSSNFSMRFDTEGEPAVVQGSHPLRAKASYFGGAQAHGGTSEAQRFPREVGTFARVRVSGLKPGMDLELFSKAGQLEYDVLLAPGVPASEVAFTLIGVQSSGLTQDGELLASVDGHEIRQRKPESFQLEADGTRRPIGSRFVALGEHRFGFELTGRDLSCPVVIDPVLVYSDIVGGSNADVAEDIAIDGLGDMYVAGWTKSVDFPGTKTSKAARIRGRDVVVFKLSADGSELIYVAFVGGSSDDEARALVVDNEGQATVVGQTKSSDFPATSGSFSSRRSGGSDAFVFQLNAEGSELNWASFIGGSADDVAEAIEMGDNGSTMIVGTTASRDFPTSSFSLQPEHNGGRDCFAVRMDSRGRLLLYSTFIGGSRDDKAHGVSVDSMGNAYLVGETNSPDFPVTDGAYDLQKSGKDAFVLKLGRAGSNLIYSTFLGGSSQEEGNAIALDSEDRVWIAGSVLGGDFPVTEDAMQPEQGGAGDGFVARLSISGSKLEYATYLGGSALDQILGLCIDATDAPWITGMTRSDDFPCTQGAAETVRAGGSDAYLVSLNKENGRLDFSSYLGMSGDEEGRAIAMQPGTENVVVVGFADDIEPAQRSSRSGPNRGPSDAIVARYEAGPCSGKSLLTDLGGGAGLNLSLTRPRLGAPFEVKVSGAPPFSKGLLMLSSGAPQPSDFESLAVMHLDRSRLTLLSKFVTDEEGNWSMTGRLANRGDLCGSSLVLQAITLDRRLGPLSFGQASQGLSVTFGY